MSDMTTKDARGFFMLPQAPEQSAYYTYGTPARGVGQFAHPKLISLICLIEHRWQSLDARKMGIGNISLPGETHQTLLRVGDCPDNLLQRLGDSRSAIRPKPRRSLPHYS